jgi:hypothetical protein
MNPTTTAEILITALAVICVAIFLTGVRKALAYTMLPSQQQKRLLITTSIVIAGWMLFLGLLANQQIFAAAGFPPRPMFTVLFGLLVILALSFTTIGKRLLMVTPLHWLVFFQAFRIGVELWFWYTYKTGVFPRLMTFEGANLDIIAGILALVTGFLMLKQPRQAKFTATAFNIVGFLILLNTLRAAALSMPSPIQQYPFDERLLRLGQPYFIYLPGILVVLALGVHILSLRQLALHTKADPNKTVQVA